MNEKCSFRTRGGAWVVGQSILMLAVVILGVVYPGDWTQTWMIAIGALLFLTGGGIGVAGLVVLGRNRTPYPRPRDDSELVQHGIFSRVRHPLYLSVIISLLGWALMWQSGAALAGTLACIFYFRAKALHEERLLREKFPNYAEYARRVPRFLPRIMGRSNKIGR